MYSLISAMAKPLNTDGRWLNIDIGNVFLDVLFSTYSEIIAVLSNPFIPNNVAVDLNTIRNQAAGLSITFNTFLTQLGDGSLVALDEMPTFKTCYAKYADGFHAKYKVQPINSRAGANTQLPLSEKTWLHLTRPNTDYSLFYKSCLVNVNGFFHLTDSDDNGIYIKDGMKSAFLSRNNNFGIYSFREIGELSFIPITTEMIYKQNADQPYKECAYIDLGVDVSDKTVMLVLGGYLHVLDEQILLRISESRFRINFNNLSYRDRYYESKDYIDFTSLNLSKTKRNDEQIALNELYSDETITAYLMLSQSFFVILDNKNVFVNKIPVRKTPLPNMFIGYQKPDKPLITGLGKVTNYWYTYEDKQYSLTCCDTLRANYIYDTFHTIRSTSVDSKRVPNKPLDHSSPYMLEIGTDIR